jgi:hypothetical protein
VRNNSRTLWKRLRKVFARLFEMAQEWAAKAGLYDLPDDFPAVIEAELRHHIAGPSLTPRPAVLLEQIRTKRQYQHEFRERMDTYKVEYGRKNTVGDERKDRKSTRWQAATSFVLGAVLLGLASNLALKGWLMLGVATVIVILNLNTLPARTHQCCMRLSDYYDYRRASAAFWRLERQIKHLRQRIEAIKEQEDLIEQRIAVSKAAVMSHYPLHKNHALQAARSLTKQ